MRQSIVMTEIPNATDPKAYRRSLPIGAARPRLEADYLCPKCGNVVVKGETHELASTNFATQCAKCSTWCTFPE